MRILPVYAQTATDPEQLILSIDFAWLLSMVAVAIGCSVVLFSLWVIFTSRSIERVERAGFFRLAWYGAFLACVGILAASSFTPLLSGEPMLNFWLLAHMAGSGVFGVLLLGMAVLFNPSLSSFERTDPAGISGAKRWWVYRWSMWLTLLAGLVSISTMLLCMLPLLSTESMELVLVLHRLSGLGCVVGVVFNLFSLVWLRAGKR